MPLAPEGHARRLAIFLSVELEVLALGEAEEGRDEVGRHGVDRRVEVAHDGVVVAARVLDRVLDLPERGLELREALVRLEVGVRLGDRRPRRVTRADVERASRVVAFGCDLGELAAGARVEQWDVPAVGDDFQKARAVIDARLARLLDEIS